MGHAKTTGKRASYGAEIDSLLADYQAVVHRASEREIVRDAIRHFIANQLSRNEGLREQFEELRKKRLATDRVGLTVISRD